MRHEHANGDLILAMRRKLGHVTRERIVEADFALLEEAHDGWRGGKELGERGEIENRSGGHALAMRDERAFAKRLAIDYVAAMADEKNAAGNFIVLDCSFDDRIEHGQIGPGRFSWGGAPGGLRQGRRGGEYNE